MRKNFIATIQFISKYRAPILVFLIASLLGTLVFIAIFGIAVINPSNVQWIQANNGDISQHYIGWLFYRSSDWSPILGSINSLAYPHGLALTFMDSIPLFAIPFKLLSPLLPQTFQYFGIWGIFSYALMGGLAGLILYKLTHNRVFAVLGSLIFSFSPIVVQRMFGHTALAGQWIILLGILLLVSFKKTTKLSTFIIFWSITIALSACIHPYFIPMTTALLIMSVVLTFRKMSDFLLRLSIPIIFAIVVFAVIGGFTVTDVATGGARDFGLNANALFNSMDGWSAFVVSPKEKIGAYEGFAYLGLGMILISVMSLYGLATLLHKTSREKIITNLKIYLRSRQFAILLVGLALLIFSVSPTINIGTNDIVVWVPSFVERLWSIFRATGRIFWPLYYLATIGILYSAYNITKTKMNKYVLIAFFAVFVFLQIADIYQSPNTQAKHEVFVVANNTKYTPNINEPQWIGVVGGKKHIQYIGEPDPSRFYAIAYFAAEYQLTMSDGHYARAPTKAVNISSSLARESILSNQARSDTIYVTNDPILLAFARKSETLNVFEDLGTYVLTLKTSN